MNANISVLDTVQEAMVTRRRVGALHPMQNQDVPSPPQPMQLPPTAEAMGNTANEAAMESLERIAPAPSPNGAHNIVSSMELGTIGSGFDIYDSECTLRRCFSTIRSNTGVEWYDYDIENTRAFPKSGNCL
jgi:hypothetical protein